MPLRGVWSYRRPRLHGLLAGMGREMVLAKTVSDRIAWTVGRHVVLRQLVSSRHAGKRTGLIPVCPSGRVPRKMSVAQSGQVRVAMGASPQHRPVLSLRRSGWLSDVRQSRYTRTA